ncbi:MAG TPA: hypothetical protein VNL38_03855 [Candidatus Nitrosotenuis sp.]|nr:hypothetical protein [Candidatus Nitrosotenuis sp.]
MKLRNGFRIIALAALLLIGSMWLLASGHVSAGDGLPEFGPWSTPEVLGPEVNSVVLDQGPALSRDGLTLYFQSNRPGGYGGHDVYFVQRASLDAPWGAPQNAGPALNTPFNEQAPNLTVDGHRMYFHSDRPGGFGGSDIYVSRRHNKRDDFGWKIPENLGDTVNTAAQDQQACIFEDEATGVISLYFTSDRSGGLGGLDIYASTLQSDETFSWPVLISELSSPANDRGPTIRKDGLEIIFPSNRPGTVPGSFAAADDLWVSTRPSTKDPWSTPVNLGIPVNDITSDAQPELSFDGKELYFNAARTGGIGPFGSFDLWVTRRSKLYGNDPK